MVDELFRSMYLEHLVYNLCKRKFDYESNGYENGKKYKPLDLYHNNYDIRIYEEFKDFLNRNLIQNGKILKMFSSCCDYHCNEIIRNLEKIKRTVDNLKDSPILDIVMKLKVIQDEMVKHEILIEDGISVNWEQSLYYYRDIDEVWMGLKDETSNEEEEEILKEFSSRYNSVITKNNQGYIIRFENRKLYNEFKDYSLNLSKPYYVFEGDVLDIIRIEREFEGIIELKPWNSFDVTNVLAKILGFRNDY